MDAVPVSKIKAWESDYREALRLKHRDTLDSLVASGTLSDEITSVFEQEATDIASRYTGDAVAA